MKTVDSPEKPRQSNCSSKYGFDHRRFHEFVAEVVEFNEPARHLLEKIGFVEIVVAYVDLPDLRVEADAQRYTCIDPIDDDGGKFRYEAVEGEFTAELTVDADGLVIDCLSYSHGSSRRSGCSTAGNPRCNVNRGVPTVRVTNGR